MFFSFRSRLTLFFFRSEFFFDLEFFRGWSDWFIGYLIWGLIDLELGSTKGFWYLVLQDFTNFCEYRKFWTPCEYQKLFYASMKIFYATLYKNLSCEYGNSKGSCEYGRSYASMENFLRVCLKTFHASMVISRGLRVWILQSMRVWNILSCEYGEKLHASL